MLSRRQHIAVIGAGVAGLTAAKALLEEGLTPVVFERSDRVGGLWNYDERLPDGGSLAYRSLRTNTSKQLTAFSDFTFSDSLPDYPHRADVAAYLQQYAEHFGVRGHVRVSTVVEAVSPVDDGRWLVRTRPTGGGEATETHFDAVVAASGLFSTPACPAVTGADKFRGTVLHSAAYKAPEAFAGQRVLIVGVGSSGADIAVELCEAAVEVLLSTVRGAWVLPRYAGGRPFDHQSTRLAARLPERLRRRLFRDRLLGLYARLGLDPALLAREPFDPVRSRLTPGTEILERIRDGSLLVRPGLERLEARAAVFTDGTRAEVDAIIYATGYTLSLPFLPPGLVEISGNRPLLYKHVFPPGQAGLALVGYIQAYGSIPPLAEMQARWVARVFAGRLALPSANEQRADIARQLAKFRDSGAPAQRLPWLAYLDELAGYVGARPSLWRRPRRLLKMLLGPPLPAQYR